MEKSSPEVKEKSQFANLWKTILIVLGFVVILICGWWWGRNGSQNAVSTQNQSQGETQNSGNSQVLQVNVGDVVLTDVSSLVEQVSPSVVTVAYKSVALKNTSSGMNSMDLWGYLMNPFGGGNSRGPSTQSEPEYEENQQDIGTGFVVEGNIVVTNKHVVSVAEKASDFVVIDSENNEYQVTQIYRDPENDLALLQVEGLQVAALALGSDAELKVGQGVMAMGTALGEFRQTVTTGVVSGLGRTIVASAGYGRGGEELQNVIQTDTAINSGNSGGPLLNYQGQVVGVNVAMSQGAENIGFALPINLVKDCLENFKTTGEFDRPFLGVSYQLISEKAALVNEIPQGAYVLEVVEGSAAAKAGLQEGDVITSFDGQSLKNEEHELSKMIDKHKIGDKVVVEYYRDGEKQETLIALEKRE